MLGKYKLLLLMFGIFLGFASAGYTQNTAIQGTVIDSTTGKTLPGVNILVKGTSSGTATDVNGHYSLQVKSLQDTLRFSFIGYQTKTIPIDGRTKIDIQLTPATLQGKQLVVVGYGKSEKQNLVGSVSSVDVKDVNTQPGADIARKLKGSMPGVRIQASSGGDPSKTPNIDIRGFNSINGGSPLILVDGIEADLVNVNPNNVKSVSVLKGAEASAIYGARGAFGVVLITTKEGRSGDFHVDYSNNISFSTNTTRTDFVTNPYTYAKWVDGGIGAYKSTCYICYDEQDYEIAKKVGNGELEPFYEKQSDGSYKFYENVDWYHLLLRQWRPSRMHNISVSGGSDKINGYISGRFYKRKKIQNLQNTWMRRYNLKVALNIKPFDWLKVTGVSKFSRRYNEEYAGTKNGWGGTFGVSKWRDSFPNYPAIIDGVGVSIGRNRHQGYVGRMGSLLEKAAHRQWEYNVRTNTLKADLTPLKGLEIKANYSHRTNRTDRTYRYHPFSYLEGNKLELVTGMGLNRLDEWRWKTNYNAVNIFGTYKRSVANNNNFKLMLGFNQEQLSRNRIGARIENLLTNEKSSLSLGTDMLDMTGSTLDWALRGYFGRFDYNYKEKYLLEVNARYDGSSRFPAGTRWGFFPSVGAGWQISNEKFWSSSLKNIVSSLKLRGSYGWLGNQTVPVNTFRQLLGLGRTTWLASGDKPLVRARIPAPLPAHISWEKVNSADIGLDIGFLQDKVTATFDVYQRTTSDMYLPGKPLPAVFGASEPRRNYAAMRNRGFELSIGYKDQFNIFGSALSFNIKANVSNNKAVITKFDNPQGLLSTFRDGEEIGEIWGYHIQGQFKTDKQAAEFQKKYSGDGELVTNLNHVYRGIITIDNNNSWNHLKAGDPIFADLNGDGRIDNGNNTVKDHGDLKRIGNSMPRFPFGFSVSANWKNVDVSILGQGIAKQDWFPSGPLYWATFHRPYVSFIRKDILNKVFDPDHPNDPNRIFPQRQRAYASLSSGRPLYVYNDKYLLNVGYLRLKNVTIGYTLPETLTSKIHIRKLRIFISGQNLATMSFGGLTKYIDPEVVGSHQNLSNPSGVSGRSPENTELYPMNKTYSVGIDLKL
jgi:TonB-linked SusC/RagA family outer membrane protein